MELNTSTWMMISFIILLIVSIWKIYAFLPNKELKDDDTTQDSHNELINLMIKVIKENNGDLEAGILYIKMLEDENFDSKHFWRFNHNRLNQLLNKYYVENEDINSIKDIYNKTKD
ncbi:MAG: hypothetical protein U9N02_00660 [Campylobacterota bacterium]|nr:hypothetical protein [Campylobacterota bacterium]